MRFGLGDVRFLPGDVVVKCCRGDVEGMFVFGEMEAKCDP